MATYKGHNEDSSGNILLSIGNGMTATVETGSTASQAYTKGSYIFFNNRFCKATSAIASGATLAIGTNLSETSVGAELTSHLRSSDGKEFYFDVKDGTYGYYPSASKTASEFVPFGGTTLQDKQYIWVSHNKGNPDYEVKGVTGTYTYGTYVACGWHNAPMSILINTASAKTFKCYYDYPQTFYFAFIDNSGNVTFDSFTDTHCTPEYAYTKDVTNIQMVMILHEGHTTYFACTQ